MNQKIGTAVVAVTAHMLGVQAIAAHPGTETHHDTKLFETEIAFAQLIENRVDITIEDGRRCFDANGIPDHSTGTFPNRGNPNAIRPQQIDICIPETPTKAETITPVRGTFGIAINGVMYRPNTAGFYDPNARRGHSRNGDRNWSLDIHGAPGRLGLDSNNAHVGRGGMYHYHGIAKSLTETSGSSLVGYAGDGYEIHYVGDDVQSGYVLKDGVRPSTPGPGGPYDGTYNEDYRHTEDGTKLDRCNGGELNGQYVYYITDQYPFVPRCFTGRVSPDFNAPNHGGGREADR